jgi:DNA helicase HerA-like ATPase
MPGNPLDIGGIVGSNRPVILPPEARERHLYVCGGTGVGMSVITSNAAIDYRERCANSTLIFIAPAWSTPS